MKDQFTHSPYHSSTSSRALPANVVSLSKSGRIGFGGSFAQAQSLAPKVRARLYWSEPTGKVAFFFTDPEDMQAYPTGSTHDHVSSILATKFFEAQGIDPSEHAGVYKFEEVAAADLGVAEAGKAFVVQLKQHRK